MHGFIIDAIGSKRTCFVNIGIMCLNTTIALISINNNEFCYLSFLMCLTWGWQDGLTNTFLMSVAGFEFENASDPFSAWNVW